MPNRRNRVLSFTSTVSGSKGDRVKRGSGNEPCRGVLQSAHVLIESQVVAEERVAAANFEDSEHPQYHDTRRDDAQDLDPSLFGSNCQPAEVSAA